MGGEPGPIEGQRMTTITRRHVLRQAAALSLLPMVGAARTQLLKIFEAAGPKAEVTKEGRRRLSMLRFK